MHLHLDTALFYGSSGLLGRRSALIVLNTLNLGTPDDIFMACWGLSDFRDKYRLPLPFIEENPYEMGITASNLL